MKAILKNMFSHFFVIYTGAIFGTFIFCFIFDREAVFGIDYFLSMLFLSLMGDLPLLVFYSKTELTKAQMKRRHLLHFCLIEAVTLTIGRSMGLYGKSFAEAAVFFLIIAFVYLMVLIARYISNRIVADEINKRIEERRKGE